MPIYVKTDTGASEINKRYVKTDTGISEINKVYVKTDTGASELWGGTLLVYSYPTAYYAWNRVFMSTDTNGYCTTMFDVTPWKTLIIRVRYDMPYGAILQSALSTSPMPAIPHGGWTWGYHHTNRVDTINGGQSALYLNMDVSNMVGSFYINYGHRGYGNSWLEYVEFV